MSGETRPVVFLMGPTASGKTALAMAAAERLPVDLVSVDSAMVYRGMDIGTGKPTPAELARFPHRLIDICDPAERYSAARFRDDARDAIAEIHARGRVPLLVGGTGLYFRALRDGLAALPSASPALRAAIEAEAAERGWPALHAELARLDPQAAARIHRNDPQRLQRALEVCRLTGRPLSEQQAAARAAARFEFPLLTLALEPLDRPRLHTRIRERFLGMLAAGLEDEVAGLRARGDLGPDLPSMRSVGYRQVWRHLAGEWDRDTMVERAVTATRQLAKRQMTWLRREPGVERFDSEDAATASRALARLQAWLGA